MTSPYRLPALTLGLASIVTQTILLREFLTVFQGNELVLGILLGNWLLLTGMGAALGRFAVRGRNTSIAGSLSLLALAVLPLLTIVSLPLLRAWIFSPGSIVGIMESLLGSFLLLLPFCLVAGASFVIWTNAASYHNTENPVTDVYAFESLGSVVGGIGFSLLLIFFLTAVQAALLLGSLILLTVIIHGRVTSQRLFIVLSGAGLFLFAALFFCVNLDLALRQLLFPGQSIVAYRDTPYGKLTVTRQEEQLNVFENDILLCSTGDPVAREEMVHFAMVQHPEPHRVLLIGGGLSGAPVEILKYAVQRVDYTEIDPEVIAVGRSMTHALSDPRIFPLVADGRTVVRNAGGTYDVVLVNVPDPSTAQLHRYYSREFAQEVRRALRLGGVAAFSLSSSGEYHGTAARQVSSVLYRTLGSVFARVLVIPGTRNYFLASDGILGYAVTQSIEERRIPTTYVNRDYVDDDQLARRGMQIVASLDTTAMFTTDFNPVAYARQLDLWASMVGFDPLLIVLVVLAGTTFLLSRLDAARIGMFAGGCSAAALQFLILLSFQIIYGYVYHVLGLLIAVFMAGLALGAWWGRRWATTRGRLNFAVVQAAIAGAVVLLVPLTTMLGSFDIPIIPGASLLSLETAIMGLLVGMLFSLASSLIHNTPTAVAASVYSIDLIGSAVGALLVSAFLVPAFGVHPVVYGIAGLMAASAILTFIALRQPAHTARERAR